MSDLFTRPSFGNVTLANMNETKHGVEYVDDPNHEYEVFISSDDKQVKLQREFYPTPDFQPLLPFRSPRWRMSNIKSKRLPECAGEGQDGHVFRHNGDRIQERQSFWEFLGYHVQDGRCRFSIQQGDEDGSNIVDESSSFYDFQ